MKNFESKIKAQYAELMYDSELNEYLAKARGDAIIKKVMENDKSRPKTSVEASEILLQQEQVALEEENGNVLSKGTVDMLDKMRRNNAPPTLLFPVDLGEGIFADIGLRLRGKKYVIADIQHTETLGGKKIRRDNERLLVHLEKGYVFASDGMLIGKFIFPKTKTAQKKSFESALPSLLKQFQDLLQKGGNKVTQTQKQTIKTAAQQHIMTITASSSSSPPKNKQDTVVVETTGTSTPTKVIGNFVWATKKLAWLPMKLLGFVLGTRIGMLLLLFCVGSGALVYCRDNIGHCIDIIKKVVWTTGAATYNAVKWGCHHIFAMFSNKPLAEHVVETAKQVKDVCQNEAFHEGWWCVPGEVYDFAQKQVAGELPDAIPLKDKIVMVISAICIFGGFTGLMIG